MILLGKKSMFIKKHTFKTYFKKLIYFIKKYIIFIIG